jgi:adenosylcobinamide-phosphate synthase
VVNIIIGFFLDLLIGDPSSFPHPVRFIGKFIIFLEKALLKEKYKKFTGFILTISIVITSYFITFTLCTLSPIIEIFIIYTVFSVNSLGFEGNKIYNLLKNNKIDSARIQLGYIVSRETKTLNEKDIIRSTVESISENIVDGIISPLFFLFIGGAPLAMAFKAVSTLDSMVGYKNDKYMDFGFASAKFDDILNFIPARISGFVLIPLASLFCGKNAVNSFRIVARDRLKHSSPNSGHSESAIAGALELQLGGNSIYFGKTIKKPFLGDKLKDFTINDIKDSIKILYISSIIALLFGIVIKFLFMGL